MKSIIQDNLIIFLFFAVISLGITGCDRYEILHIPISNHTNSSFFMSVNYSNDKQDVCIKKKSFFQKYLKFRFNYEELIYIKIKIIEKEKGIIISEEKLCFPGEVVMSDSAKGGLFFVIDVLQEGEDKYKVIYSSDVFLY